VIGSQDPDHQQLTISTIKQSPEKPQELCGHRTGRSGQQFFELIDGDEHCRTQC